MYIDSAAIITIASVLGALTAIGAVAYKIIKWFQAQEKQTTDIEDLKKQEKEDIKAMEDELCLLTYAVLACLKGLKEQGCNGPVTEAIGKIEKHIGINSSIKCNNDNLNNNTSRSVAYVVMHYTGNSKDTAKANANYFGGAGRNASAHLQEFKNKVKGILGGSVSAGGQQHTAQPTTDNVASYKVKITADVLNVRIGPGTDYGVATQVKQGEVYTIVGEVRNGNTTWGKLKSGAGYISLGYTERIAGMTANTPQDTSYRVKINTAVLNVRKGPGTNYPVTTQVKQGEVYTIVGEEKNGNTTWGKLKSGAGYISLGYTQRA